MGEFLKFFNLGSKLLNSRHESLIIIFGNHEENEIMIEFFSPSLLNWGKLVRISIKSVYDDPMVLENTS